MLSFICPPKEKEFLSVDSQLLFLPGSNPAVGSRGILGRFGRWYTDFGQI